MFETFVPARNDCKFVLQGFKIEKWSRPEASVQQIVIVNKKRRLEVSSAPTHQLALLAITR